MNDLDRILTGEKKLLNNDFSSRNNDLGMDWYDLVENYNAIPYKYDTAIIVTTYNAHLKFLKATLANYRKANCFILGAYDSHYRADNILEQATMRQFFLRPEHLALAHAWVFKHGTYDNDKRDGWFWNVRYAQGVLKQFDFKYVFCTNGDCIWDKPEGLHKLKEILGGGDLMGNSSSTSPEIPNGVIHTASVLYKIDAFNKIIDWMNEKMKHPAKGYPNHPEQNLRDAVYELGLKETVAPIQPLYPLDGSIDHYTFFNQPSTWKDVLGYRNLGAELEYKSEEQIEPIESKYFDFYDDCLYFSDYERNTICKFYLTGDRRYLYQYWDQSEDSDYNRKYYPIEHYGEKPIYEWTPGEKTTEIGA